MRKLRDLDLNSSIQQFYGTQMQLLDDGAAREWAETFTEGGIFVSNAHPAPVQGRAAIEAGAQRAIDDLRSRGIIRRHWLGMLTTSIAAESSVRCRSYALLLETPRGAATTVRMSTVCDDLLQWTGDTWLVAERVVTRDDLVSFAQHEQSTSIHQQSWR